MEWPRKAPFIRKRHPVTDQSESGSGRGRFFGGICEHRGVRPPEPNAAVASVTNVTSLRPLHGCVAEYRAISRTRPDVGRGGSRTIVSIAMRRAKESPVRLIARIWCCVFPQLIFIYPTSRPLSLSGLLALSPTGCRPDGCADLWTAFAVVINAAFSPRGNAPSDQPAPDGRLPGMAAPTLDIQGEAR